MKWEEWAITIDGWAERSYNEGWGYDDDVEGGVWGAGSVRAWVQQGWFY